MWKFRSTRPSKDEQLRAARHRVEAMERAEAALGRVKDAAFWEATGNPEFARYLAERGAVWLLSFELHFLWGYFYAHSATEAFPTNGYDRIQILIVNWLVTRREYSLEDALSEVKALHRAFNRADPLHDAISEAGRLAYGQNDDLAMVNTVRWLMDRGEH
jgi:hypothetical protein